MTNEDLVKQLALVLGTSIVDKGLTRFQASRLLHIDATRLSNILNGKLQKVSVGYMLKLLNNIGLDVEIKITPSKYDKGVIKLDVDM